MDGMGVGGNQKSGQTSPVDNLVFYSHDFIACYTYIH